LKPSQRFGLTVVQMDRRRRSSDPESPENVRRGFVAR
jgi:hypothetical protein